jgi:adenosylmethionine-8-amino-7-oxononanoate aminotransferase
MSVVEETRLWHPFAAMGHVRDHELVIERGEDVWVFDTDGRRYLDATASLWYANVGHGRQEIADAVHTQMRKLEAYSAFGDFSNPPARELADTLCDLAPMPSKAFLVSGGGDAIDTAAKLARRYWAAVDQPDRTLLISRTAGYHGTHGFGTALGGIPANRVGFGPQAETLQVPHDSLEAAEQAIEERGAENVAGIFVEPVIGAGGVYPPMPGYMEGMAKLCERTGVLLIVDSVICGFGRLGSWFGVERWGIEPAMITFAKGVTSGYLPLGGVMVHERIAEPFWSGSDSPVFRHGPTYAAHATCCAAALANIALLGDGLIERGAELEQPLHDTVRAFVDHPAVSEARGGTGFLAALEFNDETMDRYPDAVNRVVMGAREQGVLIRPLGRAIALSPPLTTTQEHLELIQEAIEAGLKRLA